MPRHLPLSLALLTAGALSAQYTATVKTTVTTPENTEWKKWSDKECVINYPGTWTNEGPMGTGAIASFFAPPEPAGGFRERVTLTSLDATGRTMEQLMAAMEAQNLLGYAELTKTASETGEGEGSMELLGTLDGQPVRLKRELTVQGNKAWILSYVAIANRFDDALYLADAMFMSFAVK